MIPVDDVKALQGGDIGYQASVIEALQDDKVLVDEIVKVLDDHVASFRRRTRIKFLFKIAVINHGLFRIINFIASGGAERQARECVSGHVVFLRAIMGYDFIINKEFHSFALDA